MNDAQIAIALRFFDQASGPMKRAFDIMQKSTASMERSMGGLHNAVRVAIGALAAWGAGRIAKGFIETASECERMNVMLTQVTGSAAGAEKAFDWILNQGTKAFGIQATSDAFVQLMAVGIDPTKGSLVALEDALSAFGKATPEDLRDVTKAISQIAGKGVVQMEELRQQLGERIPTAIKIMARELNMSMGELFEQTKKGAISATVGLDALFQGLAKDYGGMTDKMAGTWQGLMNKLDASWFLFKKEVMDSEGLFSILKAGVTEFLNEIIKLKKDGTLKEWAKDIALGVIDAFEGMINAAQLFGVAVNNARSMWASLQIMRKERQLEDLNTSSGFWSTFGRGKGDTWGLPGASDKLKSIAGQQQGLIDEIAELNAIKYGNQDKNVSLISNMDAIRARINNIRAAANAPISPTDTAAFIAGGIASPTAKPGASGGGGPARNSVKAATDDERALNRIMEEGNRIREQMRTPAEEYAETLQRLDFLLKNSAISQDTFNRAATSAFDEYNKFEIEQIADAQKELNTVIDEGAEATQNFAADIQNVMGDSLYDALSGNFEDIGDAFAEMLLRMVADATAAQLARSMFGSLVEGGTGSGFFGSALSGIASLFGGGMASGGSVQAGRAYVVGEERPELFVPSTNGRIIPSVQASSGNTTTIVQPRMNVSFVVDPNLKMKIDEGPTRQDSEGWIKTVHLKALSNDENYLSMHRSFIQGG